MDNDNIVDGTYVISFADANDNAFTALTDVTDYSLDKESGRIFLTGTGKSLTTGKVIYGTYWYSTALNDDQITEYLSKADEEIDRDTGRTWGSSTPFVEYQDGKASLAYPTTDYPFQSDYDDPDFLVLDHHPILKINNVFFLSQPPEISKFYNYDDNLDTFTDFTDEVNSSVKAAFTLFASTPAPADIVYVGSTHAFLGLEVIHSQVGVDGGSLDVVWEYYDGSTWSALTLTETDTGSSSFTADGRFTWSYPLGWQKNSVNSNEQFWVRARLNAGSYSTVPKLGTLGMTDSVSRVLEPRNIQYETYGELNFRGLNVPNGVKNIRVDYNTGYASTPENIKELSVWYASVKAYVTLSGGSYDDATLFQLGSKQITIGEVYVNIERVLLEFRRKINELLDSFGRRADIE